MKLTPETIAYIVNAIKTAKLVGIEDVIIEPDMVRAMDPSNSVVLFQNTDVPDMPFGSIGLTRINTLLTRYDIASSCENFNVTADVKGTDDFARSLLLKGKGIKVDYRCGKPLHIKAPRQVNDTLQSSVTINSEAVTMLQKGASAMGADLVSVISNDDGVSFEISDVNSDIFSYTFADSAEPLTDDNKTTFANRYPIKIISALFKSNPTGTFSVGAKGIMSFPINGLTVFVLPQI